MKLIALVLFISGCSLGHFGREEDAVSPDAIRLADAQISDSVDGQVDAVDAGQIDPDGQADAVDAIVILIEPPPDAEVDAGVDVAPDAQPDVAPAPDAQPDVVPDVPVNHGCTGYDVWCEGACMTPSLYPTMCGGPCHPQVCGATQTCSQNLENVTLCCSPVLVIPGGTYLGACPAGSCDGGHCFARATGFSDITWFCCPPAT